MFRKIMLAFWLITTAAVAQELPYREVRRAMLVEAEVNGRPAHLIVDTGADNTVLSPEMLGLNEVDLAHARFGSNQPGLRGEALIQNAEIKFATGRKFLVPTLVMKLENVSKAYGVKVDGLLGQDILSRCGRISIDYRAKTIQLGAPE